MYYLSAFNRVLFKSCYCQVLFSSFEKSFRYYEKHCQFHLYIFLKKNSHVNKCDVIKNEHIFPSKICHLQYGHRFLFRREMGEHQTVQGGTSKNEESFGKSFSFPFSVKCFDKNFKCFLSCTLPFLNVLKFEKAKQIKRDIFHYFL